MTADRVETLNDAGLEPVAAGLSADTGGEATKMLTNVTADRAATQRLTSIFPPQGFLGNRLDSRR